MAWTCPDCGRAFGARGQSHMCAPGTTLEEFFASARPEAEPIFNSVNDHFVTLDGDLIVDPLADKILFKNGPTACILKTMRKWVALELTLRRRLDTCRVSRKITEYRGRYLHAFNLTDPCEVDEEMREWLTEAFYRHGTPSADSADPMVPDDIDQDFLGEF